MARTRPTGTSLRSQIERVRFGIRRRNGLGPSPADPDVPTQQFMLWSICRPGERSVTRVSVDAKLPILSD